MKDQSEVVVTQETAKSVWWSLGLWELKTAPESRFMSLSFSVIFPHMKMDLENCDCEVVNFILHIILQDQKELLVCIMCMHTFYQLIKQ